MARRLSKSDSDRFVVHHDTHPQTIAVLRTRAEPVGIELVVGDVDDARRRVLRRAVQPADFERCDHRLARRDRAGPRRRRSGRRRHRPPGVRARHPARPARRRHRHRVGATLRRADGVRRPPRRVHRRPRAGGSRPARAHGRGQHRHRRAPGAAPRAADPRAAHPPGEGDVEHLHRPGAAGQHRRVLRRLARPRRAAPDRRADSPADVDRRRRAACRRARRCATTRGSTPSASMASTPTPCSPRLAMPGSTCATSTPRVGLSASTRRRRSTRRTDAARLPSGSSCRSRSTPRPTGSATRTAHRRVPHPVGVQPIPHRARDAPLPPPAGRQRPRPRSHDDPAGFVHDEAQRHRRDGADHLARVRRHASVRPGRRVGRAARADRRARGMARRDHRLRRRQPAAQRRQPGRVRRAAGNPRLPPQPRRGRPERLPHPVQRPRHQRGQRGDGRDRRWSSCDATSAATSTSTTCEAKARQAPATGWRR